MKYNVEEFPKEAFDQAAALVRSTLLQGGSVESWNSIRRVTTKITDLETCRRPIVEEELAKDRKLHGITFASTSNQSEFDIWLNPDVVDAQNDNFRATVLHELCHGYLGVKRGHDKVWRRLYARVLFHYHYAAYTIDHYESLVTLANWRYTKRGKTESTDVFLARIKLDCAVWLDQAEQEFDKVQYTWLKMILGPNWTPTPPSKRVRKSPPT